MSFTKNLLLATGVAGLLYAGTIYTNKHKAEKASGRDTHGAKVVISTWDFKNLLYVMDKNQQDCILHLDSSDDITDMVLEDYGCDGTVDHAEAYNLRVNKDGNMSKSFEDKANTLYNKLVDRHDLKNRAKNYLKEEVDFEKYLDQ